MQPHFPCPFSWSEQSLNPLICREYLPVLEVTGEFPGNNAFHELPNGVRLCEYAVSIQLLVVFFLFGNRSQEAVCPVFGNIAFVKAFWVSCIAQPCPLLLGSEYQILSGPGVVSFPLLLRASFTFLFCEFIIGAILCKRSVEITQYMLPFI